LLVLAALPLLADVRLGAALRNGLSGQSRHGCGVGYGISWLFPLLLALYCLRQRFGAGQISNVAVLAALLFGPEDRLAW